MSATMILGYVIAQVILSRMLSHEVYVTGSGGGADVKMGDSYVCRGGAVAWGISSGSTGVGTLGVFLGENLLVAIGGGITPVICRFGCGLSYQILSDAPLEFGPGLLVVGAELCWLKSDFCC